MDIGANPSAEDLPEQLDDKAETVIDVIHSYRLNQTTFRKDTFTTYIKMYLKKLATALEKDNPERLAIFRSKANDHIKKLIKNIDEYDFYTGESDNDGVGMVILKGYREDQITPYFIYIKDGLVLEKI